MGIFSFHNAMFQNIFQVPDQASTSGQIKVDKLSPGESIINKVYIDFGDSKRATEWVVTKRDGKKVTITIEAPMGEQIEPITMTEEQFMNGVLRMSGMNEHCGNLKAPLRQEDLYAVANCNSVNGSEVCIFKLNFFKSTTS